ncbi:MAG: TIGR03862 family flavoprotein [Turneriella sp.]
MTQGRARKIAIIGTGPAGLMAASVLAENGIEVHVYEKHKGAGRKLLIAGSSGLNISNSLPLHEFAAQYEGPGIDWLRLLQVFSPEDWLAFIHRLGLETFEGTSGRYFVREMKASGLLRAWLTALETQGVTFHYDAEWQGLERNRDVSLNVSFSRGIEDSFDAVVLALGGASWLAAGDKLRWPKILARLGLNLRPFRAANCGFAVNWKPEFLAEAEQQPLKNVIFSSSRGGKKGDLLITSYGIEGTPIYACGQTGPCTIDLKPDLTEVQLVERLNSAKENLSPMRRIKQTLNFSRVALALLYHHAPAELPPDSPGLASLIKAFPLELLASRPLTEAISSAGGLSLTEIDQDFQLRKLPGVYAVGEMLDWTAPTGGFLIQACVAQARVAAQAILAKPGIPS